MTSVESNIISLTVLNIFHVKKYDLDFWLLKVIQDQIWWRQSKAMGAYLLVLQWGPTSYLSAFSKYFK